VGARGAAPSRPGKGVRGAAGAAPGPAARVALRGGGFKAQAWGRRPRPAGQRGWGPGGAASRGQDEQRGARARAAQDDGRAPGGGRPGRSRESVVMGSGPRGAIRLFRRAGSDGRYNQAGRGTYRGLGAAPRAARRRRARTGGKRGLSQCGSGFGRGGRVPWCGVRPARRGLAASIRLKCSAWLRLLGLKRKGGLGSARDVMAVRAGCWGSGAQVGCGTMPRAGPAAPLRARVRAAGAREWDDAARGPCRSLEGACQGRGGKGMGRCRAQACRSAPLRGRVRAVRAGAAAGWRQGGRIGARGIASGGPGVWSGAAAGGGGGVGRGGERTNRGG
jgi:hypothetical protein